MPFASQMLPRPLLTELTVPQSAPPTEVASSVML